MTPPRTPHLRILRDSQPFPGAVWVVDENTHPVAVFCVKLPECHIKGSTTETINAGLNLDLANELTQRLQERWSRPTPETIHTVTVLDTKTGERTIVKSPYAPYWVNGHGCCDCGRNFAPTTEPDPETPCGHERFLVVHDTYQKYSLLELNNRYPTELLTKYGITS